MGKGRKLFLTDFCLTPREKIPTGAILCERDRIIGIGGSSSFSRSEEGQEVLDFTDCYAMPGFIDSHIHGIGPFSAADTPMVQETLSKMSERLVKHGITTFCPTIVSRPSGLMLKTVEALVAAIKSGTDGADVAGIHLEGPFLNPEKRGSQDADAIMKKIDFGFARELLQTGENRIKLFTFAPELEHSEKLVELMLEYGAIPTMGHSNATEEETLRCIDAGALRCTYIFNGMPLVHHRESSLTIVALTDDRVTVEMICDGAHIHPRFVDIVMRCKPSNKVVGISNSVASAEQTIAKQGVVVNAGGVIAGATMSLEYSWQHLTTYANINSLLAAQCFTCNPAENLGLITRGQLMPGQRADITFFDTKTNRVRATVVRGKIVYQPE